MLELKLILQVGGEVAMSKRLRLAVLAVLVAIAVSSSLVSIFLGEQTWDALLLNFGTEMAGAIVTYTLLELVLGERERSESRKAELITRMSSDEREVAVPAAKELRRRGWLTDGSLYGANLVGAKNAKFTKARSVVFGGEKHVCCGEGVDLRKPLKAARARVSPK